VGLGQCPRLRAGPGARASRSGPHGHLALDRNLPLTIFALRWRLCGTVGERNERDRGHRRTEDASVRQPDRRHRAPCRESRRMSLRTRLMLLVLLATLLPALWVGWQFVRDSDAEIAQAEQQLAESADNLAEDLDHRVQGTAQLHYGLARSGLLDGNDKDACSSYLADVREAYPQYTGIVTALPDGRLFCDSLRSGREVNLSDRPYFQRVMDGAGLTLDPVFGRITGNAVLQVVYPARTPEGRLRFMLVASLNLKKFAREARWQGPAGSPQLVILDSKGSLMAWDGEGSAIAQPGTSLAGTPLFALAQSRPEGGIGELTDADGRTVVWAVTGHPTARNAGLHLMLGRPKAELVAAARLRLRQDLSFLLVVAGLAFGAVWLFGEFGIREPVGRIVNMVRALGSGNLGARIAMPYPRGELGSLMAALNSTAASLERQRTAIAELGEQLRQAQKLEAIGTLAGGIAHDFNNVLGAILGNLAIAAEEAANGQPTEHSLEQIRRAALRARDLVQRIQAFGRRDAPKLARQPLQPIVEEVLALVQVASPAGVTLQADLKPVPWQVMADATQLHQVLMNLCTNAWQSLQGAAGTVSVGLEDVVFEDDTPGRPADLAAGRHAHLWVRDTGCGIAEADRERVFEPFFTTKGLQGGTGLGLSMVHGIVKAHHGAVKVESAPGQGSCFHVYLPLLAPGTETPDEPASVPSAGLRGGGEHVVYIDDDEVMRLMVERLLARAGYRVSSHGSAQAALAAIGADPAACDLVVTDFNMPELSGLEVSRRLAALRPGLPVLIISGYIADDLPAQARSHGVRGLVRKENVLEELVPAIARTLGQAST